MSDRRRRARASRRAAPASTTTEAALVGALGFFPPLVFLRGTDTVFTVPKLLNVAVLTVALLGVVAVHAVRVRALSLPAVPAAASVGLMLAAIGLATVTSGAVALSLYGHHGRSSGLLLYLCGLLVVLIVAAAEDRRVPVAVAGTIAAASGLVALYAVLQRIGVDPIAWGEPAVELVGSASTLGNPNFTSAHAAIGVSIAIGVAAEVADRRLRIAALVLVVVGVAGTLAAGSVQGILAVAAAAAFVAVSRALRRWSAGPVLGAAAAVACASLALIVVGAAGRGPLQELADRYSTQLRVWDWSAALAMARERPLLGMGFDRFGAYAHAYRPAEAADLLGPDVALGTPHSVPLAMLTGGGALLLLAYVGFVGVTAWALLRGLRRLEAEDRTLLVVLGAGWTAYQLQSVVSLDVPSLLVTHALLAGAVLGLGFPPRRWTFRAAERGTVASWVAAAVLGLAAVGLVVVPVARIFAADLASGRMLATRAAGDPASAVPHGQRAVDLAPHEPHYGEQLAFTYAPLDDGEGAVRALLAATEADPRALSPQLNLARLAVVVGEQELAAERYLLLLELEPHHVGLHEEAFEPIRAVHGDEVALDAVTALAQRRPGSPAALELLAASLATTGDQQGAADAADRAASLRDGDEEAT